MSHVVSPGKVARFGVFEFSLESGEVRRNGLNRKLRKQVSQLLAILLEHAGEVVGWQTLRMGLWPEQGFGDFEHSLHVAINNIRQALGDSAASPRFVENVRGLGYRFIAPVSWGDANVPPTSDNGRPDGADLDITAPTADSHLGPPSPNRPEAVIEVASGAASQALPSSLPVQPSQVQSLVTQVPQKIQGQRWVGVRFSWPIVIGVLLLALIDSAVVARFFLPSRVPLRRFQHIRLTATPKDSPVYSAAISPNGKYIGYSDQQGIHLQALENGETRSVPPPPGVASGHAFWEFESWYPNSTQFLARLIIPGKPRSLWSVPFLGGAPQELIAHVNGDGAVSPDGSTIIFTRGQNILGAQEIWRMGLNGESPQRILSTDGQYRFGYYVWSPTGERIAYETIRGHDGRYDHSIKTCDLNGAHTTAIISDEVTPGPHKSDFAWIAPGRLIYERGGYERGDPEGDFVGQNLWELRVDAKSGVPKGEPRQITDWSGFSVYGFSATANGKTICFQRGSTHWSVFVGDLPLRQHRFVEARRLTMDEYFDTPFAWTADSRAVIFVSDRDGFWGIYKQPLESDDPQLITGSAAIDIDEPRLSPDGSSVVFPVWPRSEERGALPGVYRAPVDGGPPQRLFEVPRLLVLFCAGRAANFCAYASHSSNQQAMIITGFNPADGKQQELTRLPIEPNTEYHWALAPDGSQMALLKSGWNANQLRLLPLRGGHPRAISVKGCFNVLNSLEWAPDSQSVFVGANGPSGATLLRIGLNGTSQAIWQQPQANEIWGIPSPDGRRIAIHGNSVDAHLWTMSNF
jgi:DNA-binding winged helix-turn-helix (wHTH) protein